MSRSLQLAFSAAGLTLALTAPTVHAQSNANSVTYGTVAPGSGDSVVIENKTNGVSRTVSIEADGRWRAAGLPIGPYGLKLMKGGQVIATSEVELRVGQGVEVSFATAQLDTVTVVGRVSQIDVERATSGVTFTAKQLESLPIGHSIDAVVLLAPNTTAADARIGGTVFAGSSASENAYYVNGFPITNPLTQLGSSQLPWGAIENFEVLTGGYGAEFGRSTGGVVNIVTKRGGNEWKGGVQVSYQPSSWRSTYRDYYNPVTGYSANIAAGTDGALYRNRSTVYREDKSVGAYFGGPLIKDKMFFFFAGENDTASTGSGSASSANPTGGWTETNLYNTRYVGKWDWFLTPEHHLEATVLGDRYWDAACSQANFDYKTGAHSGACTPSVSTVNNGQGGSTQVLRYTGNLTDDLMVTAQVGRSFTPHSNVSAGIDPNVPQSTAAVANRYPGITYANPYPAYAAGTTGTLPNAEDKVKQARVDVEYTLGAHRLRVGADYVDLSSKNAGEGYLGGGIYVYSSTTNANLAPAPNSTTTVSQAGALNTGGRYYYGRYQVFQTAADASSKQSAQYVEDVWQATKNLLITPGLRFEQFKILNAEGQKTIQISNQVNPRVQFAWDISGNAKTKVYGSAGRYGVQLPTSVAIRGASASTYSQQYFAYTGVDAKGAPTGVTYLNSTPYYVNNENGSSPDPRTVAAQNLKPNNQDEITLGIDHAYSSDLTVGAKFTYRRMQSTLDDMCDERPFDKYALDHSIDTTNWGGFGCATFNPGRANTFLIDYSGTGSYTSVNLSAADLGFVKPKRSYIALDFYLEHALKNGWFGRVTYTYSKNKGNTEGQVMSDIGQTDIAATQAWDFPELMQGSYGYLPNDRRHQIKAYGFYRVAPEFDVGANLVLESGRPRNCIGNYVTTSPDYNLLKAYGAAYFYCSVLGSDGKVALDASGNPIQTFVPRGTAGHAPINKRLDMNVTYRPNAVKGLMARLDIFNVFNSQIPTYYTETHETNADPTSIPQSYGQVGNYTAPRSMKVTVSYEF
ncbi:TonB-dependent receptor plug domain-containing protein [Burkholderiaceae bacterium UC74_6]